MNTIHENTGRLKTEKRVFDLLEGTELPTFPLQQDSREDDTAGKGAPPILQYAAGQQPDRQVIRHNHEEYQKQINSA